MFCPRYTVGCFVSLEKNMWWFLSTYTKMDVGGYVRGVFCPYTDPHSVAKSDPRGMNVKIYVEDH